MKAVANFFQERCKKAKELIQKKGLSGFLFSSYPSVFYLSGLRASHAYVILSEKGDFLITDARYFEKAKKVVSENLELRLLIGEPFRYLKDLLKGLNLKKIGFEKERLACEFKEKLKSRSYRLYGVSNLLRNLRLIKDEEELNKIKQAVQITDKIYKELLNFIRPGLSELEIRGKILELAFKYEAQGEAFPSIVATGAHSAIPHWESSRAPIQKGPLLIDIGVIFDGYCSDFTRTLYLGKANPEFKRHYELVKTAWYKAFEKVREGVPIYEIDRAVREFFKKKGVLSHFTHATGHGIGIEIHEFPRVYYKKSRKFLKEQPIIQDGMVFTVEPGLYFAGNYGIRLENVVFVEKGEGKVYSEIGFELFEL